MYTPCYMYTLMHATTSVQETPIERARRDLSIGATCETVGGMGDERRHLLCAELMESEILVGEMPG